jgi:hypothetical protein
MPGFRFDQLDQLRRWHASRQFAEPDVSDERSILVGEPINMVVRHRTSLHRWTIVAGNGHPRSPDQK